MFDWLINFIEEHFLNKNFKNSRMITPGSYYSFKKTKTKNKKKNWNWPGTVSLNWLWGCLSIRKITFPLKNRVKQNIANICNLQPNEILQKWFNCKYPKHILCFRTYSKHLCTIRPPVVYFLFVKLKRRWK